ncbi:alpha/beta fold hydrolase [Kineosporia sp. A_224]|uniref:alpha/beta fold hydrolase n=1 Tax=Kineosporia sp. A_224 TaxID=1962180 RepID=UPI000B4B3C1A|nr:alpha/beta hydrolase [Kineosporia sp. A_224]
MGTFTTRDGCPLDYRVTGEGEHTLVLLHGWSQSQAMFDRVRPALAQGRRVVSLDMRGHGESGRSTTGARISSLAADLHDLLGHLGVDRASFVGHSMGASVLWSFVDMHGTSRVESLVVIDQPSVCAVLPWMTAEDGADAGAILDMAGAEGFCAALLGADSGATREGFLASMLRKDIPADDFAWLLAENLKFDVGWGTRLLLDHVMQDWRDVLPRIDVPTLVIGGEVSHVDARSQRWTAAQIPGARLRVFTAEEGGAHFPFFEGPAAFLAEVDAFLPR